MKKYLFYTGKSIIAAVLPCILSGCSVGPDYQPPKIEIPDISAESTRCDAEVKKFLSEKWWNIFGDSTLNALEEAALTKNSDIQIAIASIEAACAAAGVASADYFPSAALSGAGTSARTAKKGAEAENRVRNTSYNVAANISYEIDFWGKYRRGSEAAKADLMATHAAKEAVILTITSEVAKIYFTLRSLDAKLAIARRTLRTRESSLKMYKSRFESGYCTELDYLRILSEKESVKSAVLNLEASYAKTEHALSALIGASPKEMIVRKTDRTSSLEKLRVPSDIPSGLPSNLIERRPDVAEAEGHLIAANAKIGIAIAGHFPSFSLTGMYGFETQALKTLFNTGSDTNWYGLNIGFPLFNGGKTLSITDMAKAQHKQAFAKYGKIVSNAFHETLDALVVNRKSREIVRSRTSQMKALMRSYEIAKIQKESGLIGLIDLLDVERGLLASEMELVAALEWQLGAVVDLCKALGGGWTYSIGKITTARRSAKT